MDIRLLLFFLSKVVKQTWNGLGVKDLAEPKPIVESYAFKAFDWWTVRTVLQKEQ